MGGKAGLYRAGLKKIAKGEGEIAWHDCTCANLASVLLRRADAEEGARDEKLDARSGGKQ